MVVYRETGLVGTRGRAVLVLVKWRAGNINEGACIGGRRGRVDKKLWSFRGMCLESGEED